jgi:hypothetical protein
LRISFEEVPLDVRRAAAQRLESIRGTALGHGADAARLGGEVCPIHRPDLDDVAYYEFELVAGAGTVRLLTPVAVSSRVFDKKGKGVEPDRPGRSTGHGFIVASAGPHDFPIPHWSLESPPPSRLLERLASRGKKEVARVLKLDALAYVAEDAEGERVATLGDLPKLVSGLPHDLRKRSPGISSVIASPPGDVSDDEPGEAEHRVERVEQGRPQLKPVEVESWSEFRERYADTFGPFLAQLERQAREAWEIDRLVSEFGEGIMVGESHRVALLHEEAKVEVSGEAASFVSIRMIERNGPPAVEIHADSLPEDPKADLELAIRYGNKEEERLRFFVVSRDVPSTARGMQPPRAVERP